MNSLFLSYSRKDSEVAEYLYNRLSGAGYSVWKDNRNIALGGAFPQELSSSIMKADYFLVLLSASSLASDWVNHEINIAIASGRRIIPVRLEEVQPPPVLLSLHYLDMLDTAARWKALHKLVNDLLGGSTIPRAYNMSGHTDIEVDGILILDHCDFKYADLNSTDSVIANAEKLAQAALPYLKETKAGIIPPGHPALASATLAYLLGVNNKMPRLFWTRRNENDNFEVSSENIISLQGIRNKGFELREKFS